MNSKKTIVIIFGLLLLSPLSLNGAFALSLPDPDTDLVYLGVKSASLHSDFYSYSLPILALDYDLDPVLGGGGTGPGNPYYVNSTPGAIKNGVVIATGASGGPLNTNYLGMDDAYATPSGVSGSPYFSTVTSETGGVADPGGVLEFIDDTENTWDTSLSSLMGYLGRDDVDTSNDSDLVFFWNNNQLDASQDLYGWGEVAIVGEGKTTQYFYFSDGDNFSFDSGDLVLSPGEVTIGSTTINHNLGANQAAIALFSPVLNAGLEGWMDEGYTGLQMKIRLTDLNNGYEQLFIQRTDRVETEIIPEPATILLMLSGLFGMFGIKFGKKKV